MSVAKSENRMGINIDAISRIPIVRSTTATITNRSFVGAENVSACKFLMYNPLDIYCTYNLFL